MHQPTDYDNYIKGVHLFWGERYEFKAVGNVSYIRVTVCDGCGCYLPVAAFDDVGTRLKGPHKWPE